jgi:chromosome segregation ATPase
MEDGQRYDAVALDGTFYQKSGIISGGSVDLARKAKRWDNKHVSNLQARKEKLSEDLKSSRKESEIQTIQSQVQGTGDQGEVLPVPDHACSTQGASAWTYMTGPAEPWSRIS